MQCQYCNNVLPLEGQNCPHCGAPIPIQSSPIAPSPAKSPVAAQQVPPQEQPNVAQQKQHHQNSRTAPPKSRVTYIILAVLLGSLGIHNFYAAQPLKGLCKISLSFFGMDSESVLAINVLWIILEICFTKNDGHGNPLA